MYIHIYIYIYTYIHAPPHTHAHTITEHAVSRRTQAHTNAHKHAQNIVPSTTSLIYICIYDYIHTHMYFSSTHVFSSTTSLIHVCTYIYINICTYDYIHTHMYFSSTHVFSSTNCPRQPGSNVLSMISLMLSLLRLLPKAMVYMYVEFLCLYGYFYWFSLYVCLNFMHLCMCVYDRMSQFHTYVFVYLHMYICICIFEYFLYIYVYKCITLYDFLMPSLLRLLPKAMVYICVKKFIQIYMWMYFCLFFHT